MSVAGFSPRQWPESHFSVQVARHGAKLLRLSLQSVDNRGQSLPDLVRGLFFGDLHAEQCRGSTLACGREEQLPEIGISRQVHVEARHRLEAEVVWESVGNQRLYLAVAQWLRRRVVGLRNVVGDVLTLLSD